MPWRVVLFDLDDTLYPERDYVRSGFRAVARWLAPQVALHPNDVEAEFWDLFQQAPHDPVFDRWLASRDLPRSDWVPRMVNEYRNHEPEIRTFEEVPRVLDRLAPRRFGLLSDGNWQVQERKWRALGLESRFDVVLFTDRWGREAWKPSPRGFDEAIRQLAAPAESIVYVADNASKDFRAGNALGMGTIRLRHPLGLYGHVQPPAPEFAPQWEAADFSELCARIEEGP